MRGFLIADWKTGSAVGFELRSECNRVIVSAIDVYLYTLSKAGTRCFN
jgi:hypothetical protein